MALRCRLRVRLEVAQLRPQMGRSGAARQPADAAATGVCRRF